MLQVQWQSIPVLIAILGLATALLSYLLKLNFRAELAEFRFELMRELNGRYMNAKEAERRLTQIGEDIRHTRHTLRNEMQRTIGIMTDCPLHREHDTKEPK